MYVQYGCGLSAPKEWVNFDVSPTLRIQKTPVIGNIIKGKLNTVFPSNVKYGNIITGLPVEERSCDGLYCSHTLEHLSLEDFRNALKNSYKILKPNGIFRCIVPDLEYAAKQYVHALGNGDSNASLDFIGSILMGQQKRPRGFKGLVKSLFGNSHHLWMWDTYSLKEELKLAGFREIRACKFHDCEDRMFDLVEDPSRFENAVALECRK
jgi:SAM-dependent methyltransferase